MYDAVDSGNRIAPVIVQMMTVIIVPVQNHLILRIPLDEGRTSRIEELHELSCCLQIIKPAVHGIEIAILIKPSQ